MPRRRGACKLGAIMKRFLLAGLAVAAIAAPAEARDNSP
jgi:hypothetical protein